MIKISLAPPAVKDLISAGQALLQEFEPKKFHYLSSSGQWKENPRTQRDRLSHELLFQMWKENDSLVLLVENIFFPLAREAIWTETKKISLTIQTKKKSPPKLKEEEVDRLLSRIYSASDFPEKSFPFLIIFETVLWIIQAEVARLKSESFVPDWNEKAKIARQKSLQEVRKIDKFLDSLLPPEKKEIFSSAREAIKKTEPKIVELVCRLFFEEEGLTETIRELLGKAQDPKQREESFAIILEKIQPTMGIVTDTSPACLRPCLALLMNEKIDISSGIQYTASTILSILQDPRSVPTLLRAIRSFPPHCSKIRENIIYTLGNLKEVEAAMLLAEILEEPDEILLSLGKGRKKTLSLLEEKEEAIWALGKIAFHSMKALPALVKYADHTSSKLKTYLAWTLGEIGKAQKERFLGVSADVVISLLKLLKNKNRQIFEESVSALKKIEMPEFVHSLYLYHIGAVSILGLKPAQRGLYELSETLHYLFHSKKRTILAVNGDSGTGKTYFCLSLIEGFADLEPSEILYLMRDRKKDQKIFNRILGLRWLKKYIEPIYYHDYPLSEEEDNPEEFFQKFLEENSDKRLIILDGCRDERYFQRIIDLFYYRGELDVEVNFRAFSSTRRLNLETREVALESVKTHLSFLEEPALEDTQFYQEGFVILYDLDNSIPSRLNHQETKELFEKRRIDSWGDMIRIGDFRKELKPLKMEEEKLTSQTKAFSLKTERWEPPARLPFSPEERKFKAILNENLAGEPELLQTIEMKDFQTSQIRFYAQDQIAGRGEEGSVFVLTFVDKRIFSTSIGDATGITLLGRDIYLLNGKGELINLSFERNEIATFRIRGSKAVKIVSFPRDKIVTGHRDGSIRIWDFSARSVVCLEEHKEPILSLAVDYSGRIYSGSSDGTLRQWDVEKKEARIVEGVASQISLLKLYPQGKILALTEAEKGSEKEDKSKIRIMDFARSTSKAIETDFKRKISCINVYFDGRIIAGLGQPEEKSQPSPANLVIISPGKDSSEYRILGGHTLETKDCLTMGPRIITCGIEQDGHHTIRVWGTEFYVKMELSKLFLQP